MSLFNWFSSKPAQSHGGHEKSAQIREPSSRTVGQPARSANASQRPGADGASHSEQHKVKRHARREQLYLVVREAMTHSGILSSSYKFKVLSLDQHGDQFLVMLDVNQGVDNQASNLAGIEARIVQTANARFAILVSSVYWRFIDEGVTLRPRAPNHGREPAIAPKATEPLPATRKPLLHRDPIQDDEVAAFKLALASAAVSSSLTDGSSKTRTGSHSYTLLTGFEDTEMPDAYTAPVLSATQYGELS